MRFDETADATQVRVPVASPFEVTLNETRSTGYRWDVVSDGAPVSRLERDSFEAPPATPGAPGRHTWFFSAAQAGSAEIALVYRRPFGSGNPTRRFTLRVIVE